ncbi:CDP-glycerol glycerophosphotransferase family protein, partial [Shewanella sp. 0m-11]
MKKIEFDINRGPMAQVFNPKGVFALCKQWLFAHQQRITPDLMLSPSALIDTLFMGAFRLNSSQLLRATNPRTDYFVSSNNPKNGYLEDDCSKNASSSSISSNSTSSASSSINGNSNSLNATPCHCRQTNTAFSTKALSIASLIPADAKHAAVTNKPHVILYVPSWRDSHQEVNPYHKAFNWQQLSEHLVANNQLFLLRLHPNEAPLADELTSYANIINITPLEDVYSLLH